MASLSISSQAVSSTVNLTTLGSRDWFCRTNSGINRKTTGGAAIADYSLVTSTSTTANANGTSQTYSASDPTFSTSEQRRGNSSALSSGFSWTVPVGHLSDSTIMVYVGAYGCTGTLTATLSDSSASPQSLAGTLATVYSVSKNEFIVTARAGVSGQYVTLTWLMTARNTDNSGEAALQYGASALAVASSPLQPKGFKHWLELVKRGFVRPTTPVVGQSFQRATTPYWGINLPGDKYYTTTKVYTDLVRMGSNWGSGVTVDGNGWPEKDFSFIPQWQDSGVSGDICEIEFNGYATTVSFSSGGTATASVQNMDGSAYSAATAYTGGTNKTVCKLVYTNGTGRDSNNYLAFSGTRKTGGSGGTTNTGIRNLRVLRPGYSMATAPKFSTDWLAYVNTYYQGFRFMDWLSVNNDTVTTDWSTRNTPAQRRTSYAYKTSSTSRDDLGACYEDIIDLANASGKDAYVCIPINATNDYITNAASALYSGVTNSNVNIWVTYGNELWNNGTSVTSAFIKKVSALKDSFFGNSVSETGTRYIVYASRNANVMTVKVSSAHNFTSGNVYASVAGVAGLFAGTAVDTNTVSFASTGTDGLYGQGSQHFTVNSVLQSYVLRSLTRAGGVARVESYTAHGHTTGQSISTSFTGDWIPSGAATITVVDVNTYTYPCSGATSGYGSMDEFGHNSSSFITFNTAQTGISYSGNFSPYNMAALYQAQRTCEISDLFRAVWTTAMGTRIKIVLELQIASANLPRYMRYIASQQAQIPSYYIHYCSGALYFNLQGWDGEFAVNLATDTGTHVLSDYLTRLEYTASKVAQQDSMDVAVSESAKWGIKHIQYEGGPDVYGDAGATNNAFKSAANFDPSFQATMRLWTDRALGMGTEGCFYFDGGSVLATYNGPYGAWGDKQSLALANESVKLLALAACKAANPPVTINCVPGFVDGRLRHGVFVATGSFPALNVYDFGDDNGSAGGVLAVKYLIQSPTARSYTLSVSYSNTQESPSLTYNVVVNGSNVAGPYTAKFTLDRYHVDEQPLTVTLRQGANQVELIPVGAETAAVQIHGLTFT
jgi:hypothetical protein